MANRGQFTVYHLHFGNAMPMTSVTAIIPVFNRAATVNRTIDSILGQELAQDTELDIIVVDDGSSDALDEVLSNYGAKVLRLRHAQNRGAAAARNTGIEAAKGEYIAFLDSDDVWLPSKTGVQLSEMHARQWSASCTSFFLRQPSGQELISPSYAAGSLGRSDLVWGCFVSPGSTLICRRAVFAEIGLFDTSLRRLEDWDWLLRYALNHDLGFIAKPLARIQASQHRNAGVVIDALSAIRAKHAHLLGHRDRKHLLAAIDLERAAAFYRSGQRLAAIRSVIRSVIREPFRNAAIRAVLHNRIAPSRSPT
jgi:hypothetical protein